MTDRYARRLTSIEIDTQSGPARAELRTAAAARGALILGHGAGGGTGARDLQAAAAAALEGGLSVALVEQPYRVAGRRSPAPAHHLDGAWIAVVERLRAAELEGQPLITGGRSSGARVACRTATQCGAIGVLCLAFPLAPRRRGGSEPAPSRLPELEGLTVPALVIQGLSDPFGMPPPAPGRTVVQVPGDHSLRTAGDQISEALEAWLSSGSLALAPLAAR